MCPQQCEFIRHGALQVLPDERDPFHVVLVPYHYCILEEFYNTHCVCENRYCKYKQEQEEFEEMILYGTGEHCE